MSCFLPEQWSFMHCWLTQVSIEWYFCFEVCQDIRDLFNLTTSHMSTYMVVGTLFLGFSVSFMWSGIQSFPENPPWLKLLWVNCFISAMCYGFLVPGLNGWCGWCIGLFGCCLYKQDLQWNSTVARFADIRWCNHQYYTTKQISIFQMKDASMLNSDWLFGGLLEPPVSCYGRFLSWWTSLVINAQIQDCSISIISIISIWLPFWGQRTWSFFLTL